MSKSFLDNIKKAKWTIGGMTVALIVSNYHNNQDLKDYIYGKDGNGGDMLKIWTFLTDQEISYLKFQRRAAWHSIKLDPEHYKSTMSHISDQEMDHRGLSMPREKYVEYNKRPPHDFYL